MPWTVNLDKRFPYHRKVARLSDPAFRLYVSAICWTARNEGDGAIPVADLKHITPPRMRRNAAARELVAAGLWIDELPNGWYIPQSDELAQYWKLGGRTDVRQWIPTAVRILVYQRDGHRCVECSSTDDLSLDHIHPWSLGGSDNPSNLRTLCRSCNSRKGTRVIEAERK